MPANNSLDLINLDFDLLKNSLKTYLQDQNQFRDYDYEGSNISVLLDLLSYNTTKNAFYLNMVLSEMFMDSSQLRGSITSHAKELNYLPTSRKSAQANVTITFEATGDSAPYTVPKGSLFSSVVKDKSYAFSMPSAVSISSPNNTYTFTTDIYQGFYVSDTYIYTSNSAMNTYRITNRNVDLDSLTVTVYEDNSNTAQSYILQRTLLDIDSSSKVFFLQGIGNGYYEVLFGDGIFGKQPKISSTVVLEYRNSEAEPPNGAELFSMDFDPTGSGEMTEFTITTESVASGGGERQEIESIRKLAPRFFATQERAVASDDYSSIILAEFSEQVADVNVYGGETVEPKRYGRVIVALKPVGADIAADYVKANVSNHLLKFVSIPTRVVITDPDYIYCEVVSTVQYDQTSTNKLPNELKTLITNEIIDYSAENYEVFESDFRFSKFVRAIDDTDSSIVSNDTTIRAIVRIAPLINTEEFFAINLDNALHDPLGQQTQVPIVESSVFTYRDDNSVDYTNAYIRDNGSGVLIINAPINNVVSTINTNIGTVDYATGEININGLRTSSYSTYISLYNTLLNKDIIIRQNKVFVIEASDISIEIIESLN